jgi:membrane protease YdiL (CAAX protease family)
MIQSQAWRKIVLFVVLVIAFSTVITLLQAFLPSGSDLIIVRWSPFVADVTKMWSVGTAGLIALLVVDRSVRGVGWRLCPPRYFAIAAAVPFVCDLVASSVIWMSGAGGFQGFENFLTRLAKSPLRLPLHLLWAAGEEIGWRGVLVPNVACASGFAVSALLPGAAWAAWHYPDILYFGYDFGLPPAYALTFFSISLIGSGVFLTWLRLVSGSVWPAVLAHGVSNTLDGAFGPATLNGPMTPYIAGIVGAIVSMMLGYVFWTRRAAADKAIARLCAPDDHLPSGNVAVIGPRPIHR